VPIFCKNATAIVAISNSTKQDLITHYGTSPAKIHVIPEAAADHFRPPTADMVAHVKRKLNLPDQYLLHVSTIEPRKNLTRLVDALKILRKDFPELKLILAGAKGWLMADFFAKLEQDGLHDVVRLLGWVDDGEMPALIHSATLAVQPSLYEGFGLPILEHMACGQAVAASHTSSLPEVGGDAAVYFDPTNTQDMVNTIHTLLSNPAELIHRRQLGIHQAQQFSWQRTAQETLALYEKLL
jgi:glycosyltransferase involved in cell wall biosynthesis